MFASKLPVKPLTRREMLGYAQVGAVALLVVAFGVILVQFVAGQPEWVDLGATDEFERDTPVARALTLRDQSALSVWVVRTRDNWLVLDARVPFGTHCLFQWQSVTKRFEDPCSAIKYSLAGEFVDPYFGFAGRTVQNPDRYPVSVRDGHIFIDPNRVIHAQPFIAPGQMGGQFQMSVDL